MRIFYRVERNDKQKITSSYVFSCWKLYKILTHLNSSNTANNFKPVTNLNNKYSIIKDVATTWNFKFLNKKPPERSWNRAYRVAKKRKTFVLS